MQVGKYNIAWVGIDGGREGLWKEPLWKGVLRIIAQHEGECVYDRDSPIYQHLENDFPNELWRSETAEGSFRPLFRDYPNSWTRTGVLDLTGQRFRLTPLAKKILTGELSKAELLLRMFKDHEESAPQQIKGTEKPFQILAAAALEAPILMSTAQYYWAVMKNYRPQRDKLADVVRRLAKTNLQNPEPTPYRRLRNMLTLLRTAGLLKSTRQGSASVWALLDKDKCIELAGNGNG
jgi:hypothetical protein